MSRYVSRNLLIKQYIKGVAALTFLKQISSVELLPE